MTEKLREFDLGKFNLMIDELIYDLSLDGSGEDIGDVETIGFYSVDRLKKQNTRDSILLRRK